MNKKFLIAALSLLVVLALAAGYYFINDTIVKAQEENKPTQDVRENMLGELQREREAVVQEKDRLEQLRRNLENFQAELNLKYDEYLQKTKELARLEEEFKKKVEGRLVDRQTLETYESIDPEQSAILMKNLYGKDPALATLLMRKITGKKAGKILEAMIPLDAEISTQLARDTLDFYKPK